MKKTRKAHLWIGLICSIFILIESVTGLLMNEPWLIGQTQMEGNKGNFQPGQFNREAMPQGTTSNSGQTQGQAQAQTGTTANGQTGQTGQAAVPTQFPGRPGAGGEGGTTSITGIIRGLHEGKIGTTNVKWLVDLVAIALIFLTGSGIYLSMKVLKADKKRRKRNTEGQVA
ncbi:PepSY-associated TM helix domain-containing protein [Neobacillus sp. SuZ13]|uniref:PepSY-associated TM helix domain-containing protein n=1 Tax=Neobacillus sp. SuZ13 TaxID=3047875 RepID=UPI0024C04EF7|nr:PepSY-associated TM helix domain-containing protein [Neobacillus sp. SuZ13]WHY66423.1 PepSY-associated TM helix domain-containing protein [Neobacillus sp. SuZ13]